MTLTIILHFIICTQSDLTQTFIICKYMIKKLKKNKKIVPLIHQGQTITISDHRVSLVSLFIIKYKDRTSVTLTEHNNGH